jgi:hypothetical protein
MQGTQLITLVLSQISDPHRHHVQMSTEGDLSEEFIIFGLGI